LTEGVLPPEFGEKLKPEYVAPLVLYLCSRQCTDSGLILNAGMGFYSRAAVVSGPGVVLGDGEAVPSLGDIHTNWAEIDSLQGAQEYYDANAALMAMLTGAPTADHGPQTEERGGGEDSEAVRSFFDRLPDYFQPEAAAGVDVTFQFSISGAGGGDWTVRVKDGECNVEAGVHSSPTTTLKMSDEDFGRYVGGELTAMQAYSSGRLKIEGDLMKSQLIEKLFQFKR